MGENKWQSFPSWIKKKSIQFLYRFSQPVISNLKGELEHRKIHTVKNLEKCLVVKNTYKICLLPQMHISGQRIHTKALYKGKKCRKNALKNITFCVDIFFLNL